MGNGVISISRWHSTAEIHPHDPKQSHTPQKDLTKQKTHHSSLKKKKHWQVFHVMIRKNVI